MEHVNTLPEAVTFDPTIGILISFIFWKLNIQTFPGTPRSTQLESKNTFEYAIKVKWEKDKIADVSVPDLAYKKCPSSLEKCAKPLFNPPEPQISKKKKNNFVHFQSTFLGKFSLSLSLSFPL